MGRSVKMFYVHCDNALAMKRHHNSEWREISSHLSLSRPKQRLHLHEFQIFLRLHSFEQNNASRDRMCRIWAEATVDLIRRGRVFVCRWEITVHHRRISQAPIWSFPSRTACTFPSRMAVHGKIVVRSMRSATWGAIWWCHQKGKSLVFVDARKWKLKF